MDLGPRTADALALGWLVLCWLGYPRLMAWIGRRRSSINADMLALRRAWMAGMLQRDFRVPDTALMGQVIQSVAFFASGTIIVVGALVGALAQVESLASLSQGLMPGLSASPESMRLCLLVLLAIFVQGFFRFTWALRQYNYFITMLGAAPMPPLETGRHARLADAMSCALSLGSANFNAGLRSYYFGFATLAWLIHPLLVPVTTTLTLAVLVHRQFYSVTASTVAAVLVELELAKRPEPSRLSRLL
jgi:uncharacterized membrane protein